MAKMNTKKSLMLLLDGAVLPTETDFLELQEPLIVNPNPTVEEYDRISGKLGTKDTYADTCHTVFTETVSHKMRQQDSAQTTLNATPEYAELLKIGGFEYDVTSETLVLTDASAVTLGETITGDTSSASGTVIKIDTTNDIITLNAVTGAPFAIGGEALNTASYTSTSAGYSPTFKNTQTPSRGSAKIYLDGKRYNLTDTLVADNTLTFEIGKAGVISSAMSGFIDNNGIAVDEANPAVTLSDEPCMLVSCLDVITAGGTALTADTITITTNADIQEFYALNLKEFSMQDYVMKIQADFYVDSANYADAMTKINAQTVEAIDIKLGTNATGSLINGKSVHITADLAKASAVTDSDDKNAVKRSFTWILNLDSQDTAILIKNGFFA